MVAAKINQNMADFLVKNIFTNFLLLFLRNLIQSTEGNLKEIHACMRDAIYLVAPPALFVWHNKGIIQTQYGSWVSATAAEFDRLPTQNSCFNPSLL